MSLQKRLRRRLAALAFGPQELPQFCNLGLRDPQVEVKVWLVGMGGPRDVTGRNVLAATRPLVVGIGLEDSVDLKAISKSQLVLEFREGNAAQALLGKIGLTLTDSLRLEGGELLCLFRTHNPVNYCRSKSDVWRRYLHVAYAQWRNERGPHPPDIRMVASELHALFVFYVCPRPVVLVSVVDGEAGSIFPMDLIGPIGRRHFSIALHTTSKALPLIERSGRIALSSVPVEKMTLAYQLGKNHGKASVDWASLPFSMTTSPNLGLPIPEFSLRVREMEVAEFRPMASHAFFICRMVKEYSVADGLQFFQAHGFYEEWRKQAIPSPVPH
jgi:flavin reductase (DIM6/NTAB) family NADH-FMN oxidoreductase RutF